MGNELEVDTAGLRSAAASTHLAASTLNFSGSSLTSSQPSGSGVAAVYAALAAVRRRQIDLLTAHAKAMTASSALYDATDGDGGNAIGRVQV